jgi:DNA invertase Pin-like site-specific DNA recombinase
MEGDMAKYGYARVSTVDQSLDIQIEELTKAGCDIIRSEKMSGRTVNGRDELATLRQFLRAGDELWVSRLDRLARSVYDLSCIVKEFKEKGISLKSIHENVDTSTASGEAFVYMAGIFGQLDYDTRRERQMAGIAKAKAEGKYVGKGRPAVVDMAKAKELALQIGASRAARELSCSRATIYRALAA